MPDYIITGQQPKKVPTPMSILCILDFYGPNQPMLPLVGIRNLWQS